MKRLLSSLLAFVFVMGICFSAPITANAIENTLTFNYELLENSSDCKISGLVSGLGESATLVIPEQIEVEGVQYNVVEIGGLESATGFDNIQNIVIPESVTVVAEDAFADFASLECIFCVAESLELPETIEEAYLIHYGGDSHTEPDEFNETIPATCKSAGYKYKKCEDCGFVLLEEEIAIDENAHNPGAWEQKTPATCNEPGEMVKKCTLCGQDVDSEEIGVLSHTLGGWVLDSAPTCVDNGLMHRSCTNAGCEYKEEAEIIATGVHTPGEWSVKIPASCDSDGVKVRKCTVCQFECETGVITAEHTLGEWETIKNPTCKETGSKERKCIVENCEYKETESIDKLPHTESAWIFVKDSTCSEEGQLKKICSVCKETIETATIPVKAHDFTEWEETKAPGCVETGEEKRECKNCDETETREVAVLGHDFSEEFTIDVEPNCTEEGSKSKHCSRCTEKSEVTVIDALGHDYENVDFTIDLAPTCTEVGSKSKHCTRCGEKTEITEIEATGHIDFVFETIKEATCTTAGSMLKKCKCGEELETIVTSPKEHILSDWIVDKEATCTTAGVKHKECTLCEAVLESGVIDILGHNYGEWTVTKDATCFEDGSKYRVCSVCDNVETVVIEKIAHKNAEIKNQKDATCLKDGYSGDLYCPDCDVIIEKGGVLKATGHTVSGWITDKEPTFTESGTQHKECTVCKAELQTAIIEKLTLDTPKVTIENAVNGIKVTWTQDKDAANYIVYSSQYNTKTKTWSKWKNRGTLNADSSSWVDKKVQKDVKYKYTVRAVNGKFKSDYKGSNSITFITAPKATVAISTTGLLVKWNKIDGADSYIVYRSEKTGSKWTKWTVLGTTGEAKNTWLDDKTVSGTTYKYTIRAVDSKIKSGYVATSGMIFLEQPTLTISNTSDGITGSWPKVDGAKGYTIYRSELVNGKWTKWVNLGTTKETAKSFTDKTVKSGNQYKYTLRAVNGKVKSTYKDSNILMYLVEPVLKITNEANGISGSWTQVKGAKGYIIYRSELKNGKWTKWVNLGTTKETAKKFTDKTVKSGVTYKYTVRAINGKYKSSFVATDNLVFLSVPTVTAVNATVGVKVSWGKITGAKSYTVYRRELNSSNKWTSWKNLGSVGKNSFVDTSAISNKKYQYTVRAVNGASRSVFKASGTLHYIATPIVTLEGDETGIKVAWTQIDGAKTYTIYRSVLGEDGIWSSWKTMGTEKSTKSSWVDKSTGEDIVYRYTVRAINGTVKSAYVASEPLMIENETEPETQPQPEPQQPTIEQQ